MPRNAGLYPTVRQSDTSGGSAGRSFFWLRYFHFTTPAPREACKLAEARARGTPEYSAMLGSPNSNLRGDSANRWQLAQWAQSLGADEVVAKALERAAQAAGTSEAEFVRNHLTSSPEVDKILGGQLEAAIIDRVACAAREFAAAEASTGNELNLKFAQSSATFSLAYGSLDQFNRGLEGLIGSPQPKLMREITREHCSSADSQVPWTTDNYGVTTTSETEWWFVRAPQQGLQTLKIATYPGETRKLSAGDSRRRQPHQPQYYVDQLATMNALLTAEKADALLLEEVIGAALYTGPCARMPPGWVSCDL